ncbi:hypothetical protein N0V90_003011 [Kalmusia sp. IMI 367209]|nr:hypothetical protein N0V90_003011 [Kalmusia sp. IMI 367209]
MSAKGVPYSLPPSHLSKPIVICGIIMALSASRRLISPGSILYDQLLSQSPAAIKAAVWIQNGLFWFLYGAHTIESAIFAKKLMDHRVSVLSSTWWKWMVECFIGGKFCFEHFDGIVKGKTVLELVKKNCVLKQIGRKA